jgi:hypothetical protein
MLAKLSLDDLMMMMMMMMMMKVDLMVQTIIAIHRNNIETENVHIFQLFRWILYIT